MKSVGERPQIVDCSVRNCGRIFATTKEINRHVTNEHIETEMGSELDPEMVEIPAISPLCCPLNGCNKSYQTVGCRKVYMKRNHPQCMVENLQSSLDMEVASTVRSNEQTRSEKAVENSSQMFQFPICARQFNCKKSLVHHCYQTHGWSYSKGREVGRRETLNPKTLLYLARLTVSKD